jgi:ubiquitin-protein ligase
VRVDEESMNSMNVLISGSAGTPYAHGLYHFELFCDESFPVGPPKMQILTGRGRVRFNPNLYQCGRICLSLLGTWPGNANETWNPAKSSIFQILISIQSLVMTEDVYYNEPGLESMKSTENGRLNNEGYSNVVKLANIRHAMIDMIRTPPYGFQDAVRKHFSLKKAEILQNCQKWISEKHRLFLNCSQNPHYESMIMTKGYGVLLEK